MKDKKENWEKEFKKLSPDLFIKRTGEPYKDNLGGISNTYEKEISWEVKSFISHLLKTQRQELKKKVEETFSNGFTITGIERIDVFPEQKKVKISNDAIRLIKDSIINLLGE